ncbi:hypothetical protein YC2023_034536 [Brassica napus]
MELKGKKRWSHKCHLKLFKMFTDLRKEPLVGMFFWSHMRDNGDRKKETIESSWISQYKKTKQCCQPHLLGMLYRIPLCKSNSTTDKMHHPALRLLLMHCENDTFVDLRKKNVIEGRTSLLRNQN